MLNLGDGLKWGGMLCCRCPWPCFFKTCFAVAVTSGGHQQSAFMANVLQQLSKWSGLPRRSLVKVPDTEGFSLGVPSVPVDIGENVSGLGGCFCHRHSLTGNSAFECWRFSVLLPGWFCPAKEKVLLD